MNLDAVEAGTLCVLRGVAVLLDNARDLADLKRARGRCVDELLAVDGEAVRIGTRTGELVAVYRRTGPELVPEVVFS